MSRFAGQRRADGAGGAGEADAAPVDTLLVDTVWPRDSILERTLVAMAEAYRRHPRALPAPRSGLEASGGLEGGVDLAGTPLPTRQRRRPHIQVTIAATTLLGLDDGPAELAGYGPIPAAMARAVAQDGTWRALLVDGAGQVSGRGAVSYRPGADLTGTVLAATPPAASPAAGCPPSAATSTTSRGSRPPVPRARRPSPTTSRRSAGTITASRPTAAGPSLGTPDGEHELGHTLGPHLRARPRPPARTPRRRRSARSPRRRAA